MLKRIRFIMLIFHFIGTSVFLGSVLSITLLARTHDFGGDWTRAFEARTDIMSLIDHIVYPSLALMVVSGIILLFIRPQIRRQKIFRLKLLLVVIFIMNTVMMVVPAASQLTQLAEDAQFQSESIRLFTDIHLKEDIFGIINLILFLTVMILGRRLKLD